MTGHTTWTAPGNLLIAGEYLVTEEGGRGLSMAAGGRALLRREDSRSPGMVGVRSGKEISDESLQAAVQDSFRNIAGREPDPAAGIIVDTGKFFDDRGRKLGFGSSAAAALLFACGLLDAGDTPGNTAERTEGTPSYHAVKESAVRIALDAHRRWQGGRGSGYDILCSAAGGAGLFTGGRHPTHTTIPWPPLIEAWIIRGGESVSSPGAVRIFQRWKSGQEGSGRPVPILPDMTESIWNLVSLLTRGAGLPDLLENIHELACLGVDLGRKLDVPAMPELPGILSSGDKPWYRPGRSVVKCLGAGNETILLMAVPDGLSRMERQAVHHLVEGDRAAPLIFETEGLRPETGI